VDAWAVRPDFQQMQRLVGGSQQLQSWLPHTDTSVVKLALTFNHDYNVSSGRFALFSAACHQISAFPDSNANF